MIDQSRRLAAVQAPVIPTVGRWIAATPGTISLGQGVVAYPPPREAVDAARAFGSTPVEHRYGPVEGLPPLIDALRDKLARENRVPVEPVSRIVVTAGSNMGFINALLAIADPGDEIILPTPFYFNHEMAVVMANATPVLVPTTAEYQLDLDAIAKAITPQTRAVVTVSPNNPTGAVYPEADLRALNALCRDRGVFHIHDEAYEYFTYGGARHVSPGAFPDAVGHTVSLYSLSKAYGFAGWRIGYMAYPEHLDAAMMKSQDTILICPTVASQLAAIAALETGRAYCAPHVRALAEVREIVISQLASLARLAHLPAADGAFYCLLKVSTTLDALTLAERLIREHLVAVIPGTAFGMTDGCYLRVAYGALQKETVAEGIGRLVHGLRTILKGSASP